MTKSENELILYGPVGIDWGDGKGFTAVQVLKDLAVMEGDITVKLNSGGGLAFDGVAIHNALRGHDGKVTMMIDGIAASAAATIAMAGDEIIMQEGTLMMIHNASGLTMGTKADHDKTIDLLDKLDNSTAKIYARQSGASIDTVKQLMDDETWMDGREAVDAGFATSEKEGDPENPTMYAYDQYQNAPDWLSNKYNVDPSQSRYISKEISARLSQELAADKTVADKSQSRKDTPMADKKPAATKTDVVVEPKQDNTQEIENAVKAERDRILGIENLALPGHEDLIAEMKADGSVTPEMAALRIVQAEQKLGTDRIQAMRDADKSVEPLASAPTVTGDVVEPTKSTTNKELSPEEIWDQNVDNVQSEFREKTSFLAYHKANSSGRVKQLNK